MKSEYIVEARELCKSFGSFQALKKINLQVKRGEIYGLIGDNGAGKTTFLKLLAGQSYLTEGELLLFGTSDPVSQNRQRKRMGVLIEEPGFYSQLTVEKNLEYYRIQKGIPGKEAVERALEFTKLTDVRKKMGKQLSLGMRQRLGLAIALLGEPELLLLDEPINGLDPSGIIEMRQLFEKLSREKNITILISSHILLELEQVADVYGFLDQGILMEQIGREELQEKCSDYIEIRVSDPQKYCVLLERELPGEKYQVRPDGAVRILQPGEGADFYGRIAGRQGIGIYELEQRKTSLEQYFLKLKEESRAKFAVK